jgi:hypothetical protein
MGIQTGIDVTKLVAADMFIHNVLGRQCRSKVAEALCKRS